MVRFRKIFKIVSILLVMLWMAWVFSFSNKPGEISANQSISFIEKVLNNFDKFKGLEDYQKDEIIKTIQPLTRKFAHFSIYVLGGILIMFSITLNKNKIKYYKTVGFSIGSIYAVIDEVHQAFVPGRSPQITDVIIDISGILFGIYIVHICLKLFLKIRREEHVKIEESTFHCNS